MKNLLIGCFIIFVSANFAFGELAYTPLDKSVKESNLIVEGTLQSVSKIETEELEISKGFLLIEKVVSGNVRTEKGERLKAGDLIEVHWQNLKMFSCNFQIDAYSSGIWLLQLDNDGVTKPLFPGAMVSVSELNDVRKHLKKFKGKNESVKTVKIKDKPEDELQVVAAKNPNRPISPISFGIHSVERKPNMRLIWTLLVVLGALSLNYLLYRSRFKVR